MTDYTFKSKGLIFLKKSALMAKRPLVCMAHFVHEITKKSMSFKDSVDTESPQRGIKT